MSWNEKGTMLTDSSTYKNSRLSGISMRWYNNGMARDSMNFDGEGNGVQVSWFDDGVLASAGFLIKDSLKRGRWRYYHANGSLMATEGYVNGKKQASACYDEKGVQLQSKDCVDRDAQPAGGIPAWNRFLENKLQLLTKEKAKDLRHGDYTVPVRFAVEKDGSLSSFTTFTAYGKGLEEALVKILKDSPRWTPARRFGQAIKTYHTQAFVFRIETPITSGQE